VWPMFCRAWADIAGKPPLWYFLAGENLINCFFATGGVLGGNSDSPAWLVADAARMAAIGFRLLFFESDQHLDQGLQECIRDRDPGGRLQRLVTHTQYRQR